MGNFALFFVWLSFDNSKNHFDQNMAIESFIF